MLKKQRLRFILLYCLIAVSSVLFIYRLMQLQIVSGEVLLKKSEKRVVLTRSVSAPRGEIFDRYGRPLTVNEYQFNLEFHDELIPPERKNEIILNTVNLFRKSGLNYPDTFPITREQPFTFEYPANVTSAADKVTRLQNFFERWEVPAGSSPEEVIEHFVKLYEIDENYSPEEKRSIAGVRYEMDTRYFGKAQPFTFSTDVSMDIISAIREHGSDFQGLLPSTMSKRKHLTGSTASHIMGLVGTVYKEEMEKLAGKGYNIGDTIGKAGIEIAMEEQLRGVNGELTELYTLDGKLLDSVETIPSVPGSNVVLTFDIVLQAALEKSLADIIPKIREMKDGADASAGAAVLINVNNGEILAMASNPTYDITTYNKLFNELSQDELKPLFNRAIAGTYAPGSTFKPLTAIASLEEGICDLKTIINDTGVYKFYEDYQPVCWIYSDYKRGHGRQNVVQAIENSCNYFFYEMGRQLTISKIDEYAKRYGLGEYSGIELLGESKGILASAQYRKDAGGVWYPGDTLQAAIGQSDHLFTPVQLASYVATIANGGTRYKAHLVKSVAKSDYSEVTDSKVDILDKIELTEELSAAVKEGMQRASTTGTASAILADYAMPVASKTGTASVSEGEANAVFVAFTPVEKPEVAIAVIVEHGGHGSYLAQVAKEIFQTYYGLNRVNDEIPAYDMLMAY